MRQLTVMERLIVTAELPAHLRVEELRNLVTVAAAA